MTRTPWLAALAAVLLLGGGAARAQSPCCTLPCPAPDSESTRAPFYHELPQVVFPAQAPVLAPNSNPVVWARLFEAVACQRGNNGGTCQANAPCCPRERSRIEAQNRFKACELLKLYRFYYRTGHYGAAEFVASRALQLDPSNCAAEAALAMARQATDAIDHCGGACDDAETCEVIPSPAGCRSCAVSAPPAATCGLCVGAAVMGGACQAVAHPCCTKATCACGEDCGCGKDQPCACGEQCCCKKDKEARVSRVVPRIVVIQVPTMMCPACPGLQAALPHPVPAVVPHPMAGMMPPAPPMFAPPMHVMGPNTCCPPATMQAPWGAPPPYAVAAPEQVPPPRLVNTPAPCMGVLHTAVTAPAPGALRITVCGKQVSIICPHLEARCDSATALPDGRALLEGGVTVTFTHEDRPAKIQARRMVVDLEDGSYEVSPQQLPPTVQPVGHKECCPVEAKKICPAAPKKAFGTGKVCPACCDCPALCEPCEDR